MKRHLGALAMAVAMTVLAGAAWAYWSADSVPGGNGAAAATSVNQGATPTASAVAQSVTVSWAATTLASGPAVSGYVIKRYDSVTLVAQTILGACTGTITATSCVENNVPPGVWRYSVTPVIGTNWQGAESAMSTPVTVAALDVTAPTNGLSLSSVSGGAFLSGTTVYYRGSVAGGFRVTNAVSDAGSGPASSTTGSLTGTSTGWTHTGSAVSTPAGGPYESNPFTWGAATSTSPQVVVTGRDVSGNATPATLSMLNDSTVPTASVSYPDGFSTGRSVSVTFSASDGGSGLNTRQLQRASAPLTGGSCGSLVTFTNLGPAAPTSPYVDTNLAGGTCYKYQYVVTDRVGNQQIATSANVAKIDYAGAVNATAGLLSHWRLGEASATLTSSDSFTGTNGTALTARSGEIGASWTNPSGNSNMIIGTQNRAYRNASGYSIMYASPTPSSADYSVEADLYYKGVFAANAAGVIGRFNTANTSFYMARWENDNTWNIVKWSNGAPTWLATSPTQSALVVGETYRVRLEMSGTTNTLLRLYVNGVQKASVTDSSSPFTAAGKAGLMAGETGDAAQTDATGIQFENFQVNTSTYPRAADSKGSNTGDYKNGVTQGAAGALAGDTNTAAQFDGVNDYVQMTGSTGIPVAAANRSVEAWFKTTSSARQVIFDYGSMTATQQYGLWINAGGTSMTAWGFGNGNDKVFTMPAAVNDGAWHQVVLTYNGTTLTLYIDSVALATQAATRSTVMDAYGFGIGAVINPTNANSGGFFTGSIDEVSFYTTVLSQGTVTDHYQLATAVVDTSGPTGGSVDASGLVGTGSRYSTSTTLSVALAKGTDPSGLAATGAELRRATATLSAGDGTCGTFGSTTLVATDPTSPVSDPVTDQACYRYDYVVPDTLGNTTTYASPSIKVDTTAPAAPSLAFSAFTNTWWPGSGTTVYYRSAAASGSVTTTASATDAASGIASYSFPGLGTNWTSTPGTLGVNTYSWSGAPAAPGTKNATATNNATLTSANAPFTLTADDTPPTAGTVTYADTTQTSTTVSVAFTTGTDAASGTGTRLLQRASAPLSGTTCGAYGAFATIAGGTNPGSSPVVDTVSTTACYKYQYVVSDNVGNAHTATSASVVRVNIPCGAQLLGNPGFENGAVTAPWTASSGVVTNGGSVAARTGTWKALLGGNGTDTSETVSQDVYLPPNCTVSLTYWLRVTTAETTHPFDFFRVQVTSGGTTTVQTYSDTDAGASYVQRTVDLSAYAGQTITLTFLSDEDSGLQTSFWLDDVALTTTDTTGPNGGSVDASGLAGTGSRYATSTTLSLVLDKGGDPSGVAATGNTLSRASATLTGGSCGSFGTYTLVTGGTDPVSPKSDTVSDQACYSYRYVVKDTLGNSTTYTSPGIKVDLTAPAAPSLAFSVFTNTWWPGSGTTVYYRSAAASGSVRVTGTASDAASGIASYAFPGLGTNWTSTPGALGVNTYSWSGAPAAPGTKQVTATNNAGGTSSSSPFTMTADDTAPTAGTVTYTDTTQSSTTISVAFTTGTDAGSGVGTRLLQRASATLTGTTCGSYGAFATISGGTNPGSSPVVDTVTTGSCYKYQYAVSDNVGNTHTATSASVVKVKVSYFDTVFNTSGLLNYYRLGEATTSADSMTGTTGATLQSRNGETGASWTKHAVSTTDAVITNAGRIRKSGTNTMGALYYTSAVPASADYTVEADVRVASTVTNDMAGVVGRLDTANTNGTYYYLRYEQTNLVWVLYKVVSGTWTWLGQSGTQTLSTGTTYRVALDMTGTSIRALVDGTQVVSVTDSSITAAGRGGIALGFHGSAPTTVTDSTGYHMDNFRISPEMADAKGTNDGDYLGGVTLGDAGALSDGDTAALFDGVNDYASVARQISGNMSIELWFRSTQGIGTGTQWWNGAGLVDAEVGGAANDFGISLRSDGRVVAGVGTPDLSIMSGTGFNDGNWHHVVFTRSTSGTFILYVDGNIQASAVGPTAALTSNPNINFGRIASGGNYYLGRLDEVAIYNTVLSGATVTAHYSAAP